MPFDVLCGLQSVEQVVAEAVGSSLHCHYDSESGVSSTDKGEKLSRKLEADTGAGKGASLPRKDLQKASAKGSAISIFHLLILVSVFIFFLTSECDGRRWEALWGALELTSDMKVIIPFWNTLVPRVCFLKTDFR